MSEMGRNTAYVPSPISSIIINKGDYVKIELILWIAGLGTALVLFIILLELLNGRH